MCTATWLRADQGYHLFFNRDELHTRKPASAPVIREQNSIKFIAPTDGDHGGTWIAVNQFGLSLCLLNAYEKQIPLANRCFSSRGEIVLELADSRSLFEVNERLSQKNLTAFQPFRLLMIAVNEPAMIIDWDAIHAMTNENAQGLMPLSSSSFASANVTAGRRKLYSNVFSGDNATIESLRSFHRSHIPAQSAYSVCMHREDAQTVSYSEVSVTHSNVNFSYFPESPCTYSEGKVQSTALRLPLTSVASMIVAGCLAEPSATADGVD